MMDDPPLILKKNKTSKSLYSQDLLPLVNSRKPKVSAPVTLVEKVLISRLKVGDSSAFSHIFIAYYKDLVLFALRFTSDRVQSEEIVQDAFVKLWEEHASLNISVSIKSYLLKSVQNKCIDWYRHKKILQKHYFTMMENSPHFVYDTDSYILHSELQDQIDATLSRLPGEISEAFLMSRYKGLTYHEIADILGVSVRTIEVRIGRALNILRHHLKDYFILIPGFLSFLFANMH